MKPSPKAIILEMIANDAIARKSSVLLARTSRNPPSRTRLVRSKRPADRRAEDQWVHHEGRGIGERPTSRAHGDQAGGDGELRAQDLLGEHDRHQGLAAADLPASI